MATIRDFARVPAWAMVLAGLTNNCSRVLFSICRLLNDDGKSWKSLKTITLETNLDHSNVAKALKRLEILGVISRLRRFNGKRHRSTLYQVNFVPPKGMLLDSGDLATHDGGDSATHDNGDPTTHDGGEAASTRVVVPPPTGSGGPATRIEKDLTRGKLRSLSPKKSQNVVHLRVQGSAACTDFRPSDPGARYAATIVEHPRSPRLDRTAMLITRIFELTDAESADRLVIEALHPDADPLSKLSELMQSLEARKAGGPSISSAEKPIK